MKPSQAPFWGYSFLVFASVLLFGGYSIYYSPQEVDFASTQEELLIGSIGKANKAVRGMYPPDDMSCNCTMGDQKNVLSFEKPEDCGEDRNYLQEKVLSFKSADPKGYFTNARDYSKTAEILPRKCTLFIMRRFWKDRALSPAEKQQADIEFNRNAPPDKQRDVKDISEYRQDPRLYSKCEQDPTGTPERYGHKACVTEGYVNLVYNSLIDVADCLDVPARFIAPKLSNESGLHVNAFGLVNDGGIGQFTDQALVDVAQNYQTFKNRISSSTKDSCKRLRSIPGAVPNSAADIMTADANRCHAISTPPNPLRSLVYYGIFYHSTKRNATGAFNKSKDSKDPNFRSAVELMAAAGIGSFDVEKIKEMLFVMAYNTGPGRPAVFFREWLKYRLESIKKYPITKADFNMNYWPERPHFKAAKGEERVKAMNKNGKPLTFAEYLFAYKDSVYIAAVKEQARALDKGLGEGTCTENKFLEL